MARIYKSAKGLPVDMEALRTANEHAVAAGNMHVNAKGDLIKGGKVTTPVKERITPHYKSGKQVAKTSLKPPKKDETFVPPAEPVVIPKKSNLSASVTKMRRRADGSEYKETTHPDGAIEIEEVKGPTGRKGSL
jgi:hypothetical protein